MTTAKLGWVALLPGQDGLIRINLPVDAKRASFDLPARLQFGRELHRVRPFDAEAWRSRVGEYTDGDIRLVVTMDLDAPTPFPFYADLDHDAVVPLTPVAEDMLLSEQGEELTFTADGDLRIAIEGAEATLKRATEPAEETVSFLVSGEATVLAGTLLRPAGTEPVGGVVLVHGSTYHQRDFYRMYAHALVRAGLAALIFDRPGHGASTGEPAKTVQDNAAAVEAAIDFLRGRDDIDSVGLWGFSTGMWTVPLVAARRPDVAFVAGVSAPGVTAEDVDGEFAAQSNPPMGYDPVNSYRGISCPVLLQYGAEDTAIPVEESRKRIGAALAEGGNEQVTITAHPGAGHLLERVPPEVVGMDPRQASSRLHGFRFASGAVSELISWFSSPKDS